VREFRTLDARKKFSEATYEAGLRWFANDEHMLYAKFSHGYKGGIVELIAQNGTVNEVTPELIDAWEVGWKGGWLDGELQTALTGFVYDYTDLQVPQLIQGQVLTSNAAAATIWGIEAELRWQPTPLTQLALALGHLDASFDHFCADDAFQSTPVDAPGCPRDASAPPLDPFNGLIDLGGNRLEDSPEWKVTAIARHTLELGRFGFLTPVAEFSWTSRYYRRPFNVFPDGVNDFHRTDLRLIWASPERSWTIEAFVQNLEDEAIYGRIIVGPEFTAGMPVGITPYAPRSYGLRVGYAFGESAR
jgi:iron complex outermembrane receptor protein